MTNYVLAKHIAALLVLSLVIPWPPCASDGATLLGKRVVGGASIEIQFPVPRVFQELAAQDGNPRVETGRALLMFPPGFDPARRWPVLIVTSTSDFNRTSPMDAEWYRRPAMAEGWIVLASDATIKPRLDSTTWRLAMLAAALDALRKNWPQAAKWPVVFAGFSGGAKRSAIVGAMLMKSGAVNLRGFYLSGINEDRLTQAYHDYRPGGGFLGVPVWLSSGDADPVARPADHQRVKSSMERAGFSRVRLETFRGGHQVKMGEVQRALQWFRDAGGF